MDKAGIVDVLLLCGPALSTCCLNLMIPGDPVVISDTATIPDRYSLPTVADFSARIAGSKFFSKLDLQKGYFKISMQPANIPKTAITPGFDLLEFLCLPLGLRNAAQTFQSMMDRIFGELPFCFI